MSLQTLYWRGRVTLSYIAARLRPLPALTPRDCNICGFHGPFAPGGKGTRNEARCPRCRAVERDRLFKLWLDRQGQDIVDKEVLHFAPEKSLSAVLRPLPRRYRTADIAPGRADMVLNIEAIALGDASIDTAIASHVLEHADDRKALAELFRVLKPGGLAIIVVPLIEAWRQSYEDPAIVSRADRTLHFGQWDHIRYYGADIRERIRAAGFVLDEFTASPAEVLRHGLIRGETLFLARRPAD